MFERFPLLLDRLIALDACDAYVVLVVDPETGEADAHGPFDGLAATVVADQLRVEFDQGELMAVAVVVARLHRPSFQG